MVEEVEAWIPAGTSGVGIPWNEIRASPNAKEFLAAVAKNRGLDEGLPVGVRQMLGKEAARNYVRIRQLCDEVAAIEESIRAWLATRP